MDESPSRLIEFVTAAQSSGALEARQLLPLVYDELRRVASLMLNRLPPGQTLQATSLVHEAYAKLVRHVDPGWDGRGHFFAAASQAMREILVDEARRKAAKKRGGDRRRFDLQDGQITFDTPCDDILELHEAIKLLEDEDPRKAQIVILRFFSGLNMGQIAEHLGVSLATVNREWRFARAWLYRELDAKNES
jgi:RNA polymerase sigma factor (TIGR02999 family)